jgi:hypothetical protein
MRTVCTLLVVVAIAGACAYAQDQPKAEVFAGYSLIHATFPFATDPAAGNASATLNGWSFAAAINPGRALGLVADFGGSYGSSTAIETFKPANCVLCTGNVSATLHSIYTFTAGPQLSLRQQNFTAFTHALFGGAHTKADLVSNVVPSATISDTTFAMIFWRWRGH